MSPCGYFKPKSDCSRNPYLIYSARENGTDLPPRESGRVPVSARRQSYCRLRLEFLESRFLLSGLTDATALALVSDSALHAIVAQQSEDDSTSSADESKDRTEYAGAASAIPDVRAIYLGTRNSGEVARTASGSASRASREFSYDPVLHRAEEEREERAHVHVFGSPIPTASPSTALSIAPTLSAIDLSSMTRVPLPVPPVTVIPNAAEPTAGTQGIAVTLSEPFQHAPETGTVASNPADCVPPVEGPSVAVPDINPSTTRDELRPAWRDVFRDPLFGVPIAEAVPTDLHALDDATGAFFEHLANLAPEWTSNPEWSGYLWLAAGVLLAGGGVHFVRGTRDRGRAPVSRLTAEGSEEVR